MSVDVTYLQKFRCFEDLSDEQREAVSELAEAECFYPEHTLFEENEPGELLYLLVEGEIEVLYTIGEEGPTRVDKMGAGDVVGCSILVHPYKHTSTTRSLTKIDVLTVDAKALRKLMQEDCPLGFSIQQHIMRLLMDLIISFRLGARMVGISAQVSLYPLRQEAVGPAIDKALRIFHDYGLDVTPGPMSTLVSGDDETIFAALQEAFRIAASDGEIVMVATFSNACPLPAHSPEEAFAAVGNGTDRVTYHPIGYVRNEFDVSSHWEQMRAGESRIILDPDLVTGLQGLELGQQVMVVFFFHRSHDFELLQHPRGDRTRPKRGVFSLRSPRRPNPIGVTVVELLSVDENILTVRGLDAFDGTPVLDLKPA